MSEIVTKQNTNLTTITGIGEVTASVIIGEVRDIHRFEHPNQLLAFTGLYASVHQSGEFTGTKNKLSKRGSPYLIRAIWQAALLLLPPTKTQPCQSSEPEASPIELRLVQRLENWLTLFLPFGHKINLMKFIFHNKLN
ncbi:IS110 family transposase [Enterococcus sp. AZ188]|uniref:IS110 family transposase n=1 Tax=Enterococcus sp. AZ188 TaxID=2774678 RepID=UPI003D301512